VHERGQMCKGKTMVNLLAGRQVGIFNKNIGKLKGNIWDILELNWY